MANKKFSDFTPEGNLSAYTGLVGYDATDNYFITPTELNTALEGTLYSTSPLPVNKGGTGGTTFGTGFLKASGASNFATVSVIPIANGGTGITQYGEACEVFLDTDNIGGVTLGNSNNGQTYVAPFSATAFNDSAAIYSPTFNTGTNGANNWNGGIQVLVSGKYLVEGQYFSQDGQNSGAQMEVWAEVTTTNNPHSASWPTTATAGDIYLLDNGRTSSTLSGNAGQTGSRIITISASDYVRILFRHADFPGTGFPSWQDNFTGPVNGLEGYRPRLTITRIA